ncbi:hypothetical protein HDV00_000753 [Rhizophlyctis rosea]|nr:hypothetical protein HDV00_000753 [Rhizophlyctis rosea]
MTYHVCVLTSKLAELTNRDPYTPVDTALAALWHKTFPKDVKDAKERYSANTGLSSYRTADESDKTLLGDIKEDLQRPISSKDGDEIKRQVASLNAKAASAVERKHLEAYAQDSKDSPSIAGKILFGAVQKHSNLADVGAAVKEAKKMVQEEAGSQVMSLESPEARQVKCQEIVGTLRKLECDLARKKSMVWNVKGVVERAVNTGRGIAGEKGAVDMTEKNAGVTIVDRNADLHFKGIQVPDDDGALTIALCSKVDGIIRNPDGTCTIVEQKVRRNSLFKRIPI